MIAVLEGWNTIFAMRDDPELPRFFWAYAAGLFVLAVLLAMWWRFW